MRCSSLREVVLPPTPHPRPGAGLRVQEASLGWCSLRLVGGTPRDAGVRAQAASPGWRSPRLAATPPGAAHSSDYSLWRKDQYVSNGLREFAERGEAWALMREMEAAGERLQSVHGVFSAPAVPSGTGQTSAELEAHARHSLVSGRRGGRAGALGAPAEHLLGRGRRGPQGPC